jgi:adenylate kinase
VAQAEALDAMLAAMGVALERCVAITVAEDELVRRLLERAEIEGRSDDNEDSIRIRMAEYREKTEPLVAYYRAKGVLAEVDGLGPVEKIASRVEKALS